MKKECRLKLLKDKRGHWRWRLRHFNNRIVAASTEGYVNRKECLDNAVKYLDMRLVIFNKNT